MNEEILQNIWNTLSNDPNVEVKAPDFETWKNNFAENEEIQTNVYNYLKQNNLTESEQQDWTANVMGKTEGSQTTDVTAEPQKVSTDTESTSEDGSSESQKTDWNSPELRGEWKLNTDPQGQNIWSRKYDVKDADGGTDVINEIVPTDKVPIEILKQWESTQKQDEITTDIEENQTLWEFFAGKEDVSIEDEPLLKTIRGFKPGATEIETITNNIKSGIDNYKNNIIQLQETNLKLNKLKNSQQNIAQSFGGSVMPLGGEEMDIPISTLQENKKLENIENNPEYKELLEKRKRLKLDQNASRVGEYLKKANNLWPEDEPKPKKVEYDKWKYNVAADLMRQDDEAGFMEKKIAEYKEETQGIFQLTDPEWAKKSVLEAQNYTETLKEKQKENIVQQNFLSEEITKVDEKLAEYKVDLDKIDYSSFVNNINDLEEEMSALGIKFDENGQAIGQYSQEVIDKYNELGAKRNEERNKYQVAFDKNKILYNNYNDARKTRNSLYNSYINTVNLDTEYNATGEDLTTYINGMRRNNHNVVAAATWVTTSTLQIASGAEGLYNAVKELPEDLLFKYYDNDPSKMPESVRLIHRIDGVQDEMRNLAKDKFNKMISDWNSSVQAPTEYEDINSLSDLGSFGLHVVSNFVPQLGLMAVTGGSSIYILGGTAFGNKYDEMEFTNRQLFGGTNYTLGEKWLASGVAFGSEVISEKLTYGVFKAKVKGLNNFSYKRIKDAFDKNIIETSKRVGKKVVSDVPYMYQESVSEVFAEFSNNVSDKYVLGKDISLGQGLKSAGLSGLFMERTMAMPGIYQDVSTIFAGKSYKQKIAENNAKRVDLEKLLSTPNLAKKTRERVENDILKLVAKNETLMAQNIENINMMSNKEKENLVKLDTEIIELRAAEDAINADESLNDAQKETLIEDIRTQEADLLNQQDDITSQYESEETRAAKKERYEKQLAQVNKKINDFNKRKIKDFKSTNDGARGRVKVFETKEEQQAFFNDRISEENAILQAQKEELQEILKDPTKLTQESSEVIGLEKGGALLDSHVARINQVIKSIDNQITQNNYEAESGASSHGGFSRTRDGGFEIFINKENALAAGGNINVAAHEFLHGVLFKSINQDTETQKALGDAVIEFIGNNKGGFSRQFIKRMEPYQGDAEFGEEIITVMSQSIMDGTLDYKEGLFTKIGDIIRQNLQRLGLREIQFNTGKDVYNFIKDYNASIEKNYDSVAIQEMMDKGAKGELLRKTEKGRGEGIIMKSKAASDKVQRIYEEQGKDGAFEIIEEFKPIVSRIVEKRKEAPGFDRELLTSEIEIGERGIFDLISKYDPKSGVPLAAYINKFLPSRAIEASNRILGKEFTDDVTEKVDIAAEEVTTEVTTRKPKKIVLADRLGVTKEVAKAIEKIVPDLDLNKLNFKTLKNKIPKITGDLFGIAPKKIETLANLTKKELQSAQMFINKNADLLIKMLPEGATASGTATGVPKSLLNEFYTKGERAKMAKTGTKAGLAVQNKKPNISRKEFLEVFGIIDGVPVRTDRNTSARVLALANTLGKMITNQAVRQNLGQADFNVNKIVNTLKDGKSKVMFSKNNELLSNYELGGLSKKLGISLTPLIYIQKAGKDKVYTSQRDIDAPFKINGKETGETYKEAMTRGLNSFLESNPEFRDLIQKTMTGGVLRAGFYQTVPEFNEVINDKGVEQRTYTKDPYNKNKLLDKNFVKKTKQKGYKQEQDGKLPLLLDFFLAVENHLKDNPTDVWIFEEMLKDTGKHQNTLTRILAPITAYPVNKNNNPIYNQEVVEEHTNPQNQIGKALLAAAQIGNVQEMWGAIGKSYMQLSLLKTDDVKINEAGYQTTMPDVYYDKIVPRLLDGSLKLPDGLVSVVRLAESGINLNNYYLINEGKTIAEFFGVENMEVSRANEQVVKQLTGEINIMFSKSSNKVKIKPQLKENKILNKAVNKSRTMASKPSQGISVLDFDDTLATTKSLVKYTTPDGKTGTLNAEQFANTYQDLQDQGYKFDFSDFNRVVKGKVAPLFNKALKLQNKFGPNNMFVLTARPPQAAKAIFDFLKANGLNIPLKNITGLGNSTSEAKALWIADKVGEGYNDFYFADDALQNVQAVKNMLDQFDVKSKVQQAKIQFSKDANTQFNNILEDISGVESKKRFSDIKARKRGASKGKFRFFIPPSHEDFAGLLYNFMGKGRQGDAHRDFLDKNLIKPLNRGYREIDVAKQAIANDYKSLNKQFPDVKKKLTKKTPDGDFTNQDAIRVYLWNKHGYDIPGLSPTDQARLTEVVMNDAQLQSYAETLNVISKQDTYVNPGRGWEGGNIKLDLIDATGRVGRESYFNEFNENAEIIFSPENLNKIEAIYGPAFRSALEDMLYRIKTGVNRPKGQSAQINKWMNFLNGSVGAVMFFNMRSAILQQMSIVNYINFADNNMFKAAAAFANQPQYWKDVAFIFNSDMLKQRRGGIGTDINGAELAEAVSKSKNPTRAAIGYLLKLGFTPTQIGDNIAISLGGATFLRNRINKYVKDGLSKKEAEAAAFTDFQDLTQSTQQSSRPDMTSQQQSTWIGKMVLNFQNITSQYNRLIKKSASDIYNRRITPPNSTQFQSDASNMSRILYYGGIQNLLFYSLQTALFAVMFGDEDESNEQFLKKKERVINGTVDSILRGSGIYGVAVSTLKNMAIKWHEQRGKKYNKDESAVLMELLNFSPVVGIKARKIVNAEKTINYNESVISEMKTFDADNPQWSAVTNYVEALTNFPANRLYQKSINVRNALDNDYEAWQRVLFFSGYTTWSLGLEDTKKMQTIKQDVKEKKKEAAKERAKIKREEKKKQKEEENKKVVEENKKKSKDDGRCAAISGGGKRCKRKAVNGGFCTVHEKAEKRTDGKQVQCKKIKSNGTRCKMQTTNKSGLCYYHD